MLVVDNYDSFTFNVVELLETLGARCDVVPNDGASLETILSAPCAAYVVSPGPCDPQRSGISLPLFRAALRGEVDRPILGLCLGHQALAVAAGGEVRRGIRPVHGKTTWIEHDGRGLFRRAPRTFHAAQYNSLVVEPSSVPDTLEICATSKDSGEIMALRHRTLPLQTLQFHPESHLSDAGAVLLGTWLEDLSTHPTNRTGLMTPGAS